jgi:two-component system cell cycle sensor histidine kinase/response regulator CckA
VTEVPKINKKSPDHLESSQQSTARLEQLELERSRMERSLRETESKFENLAEQSPNMIFISGKNRIIYANRKSEEIMGYSREEFYSPDFDFFKLIAPESVELVQESFKKHLRGEDIEPYEYGLLTKDGRRIDGIINTKLIDFDGERAILGIVTDVTARKEAEEALQISEERYRKLVENASIGIVVSQEGGVKFVNPRVLDITKHTLEEILTKPFADFIHPEDKEMVMDIHRKRVVGGQVARLYETRIVDKDGQIKWLEIGGVAIEWEGKPAALNFIQDITERKRAEIERQELREKLVNAQRMEAIGVLAGGVAHDLNNILGPLVAYPQMIQMKLEPGSPIKATLDKIERSAQRAADIVQDLLSLARRGRYELTPVDINELIESYLNSTEYTRYAATCQGIRLRADLDKTMPKSRGSSTHLFKVIMNLIINALDAMPAGGELAISTECSYVDRLAGGFANIEPGEYNIISVGDTGIGIEKGDLKRVFEPFYSKKKLGRSGSGLGLAIVYGVVKDHNGYVDAISVPGQGSSFYIYLPIIEEDAVAKDLGDPGEIWGEEKILVVDDVAEQRELAATILSSLGYQVETAASGEEAIEYLTRESADLVILDMIMDPGMDGLDTYRRMIELRPEQKTMICTGFSETERVREARRLGAGKIIRKPYTMQILGKAIREALNNPRVNQAVKEMV